jgi:hypothetical protein
MATSLGVTPAAIHNATRCGEDRGCAGPAGRLPWCRHPRARPKARDPQRPAPGGGEDVAAGPLRGGRYASSHGRRRRQPDGPTAGVRLGRVHGDRPDQQIDPAFGGARPARPSAGHRAVTIQLPLPAVIRRGIDPHRPAGGRTVPNTLSAFQRAELALQAAEQHGRAERLGVGAGKAHQRLDVPVGEHFGGPTGRAAVTARY